MKVFRAIDDYFFMAGGVASDRFWFFGGLSLFIGITLITIL